VAAPAVEAEDANVHRHIRGLTLRSFGNDVRGIYRKVRVEPVVTH